MAFLAAIEHMKRTARALLLAGLSTPCTLLAGPPAASPKAANPYQLQLAEHGDYRLGAAQAGKRNLASGNPATPQALGNKPFAREIEQAARRSNLDPALVHAVIHVESRYQAQAVSPKGAVGLMQLMPTTARQYGVADSRDPAANIAGGARYLRDLLAMFNNDLTMAVAAYNAGPQSVIRNGNAVPPYRETQRYVPKVLSLYQRNQTLDL